MRTRIGGSVSGGPHGSVSYRVVGQALFADLGDGTPLAGGALFTPAGLARIFDGNNESGRHLVADFAAGADHAAVLQTVAHNPALSAPATVAVPLEINRINRVDWLPVTLAILVGGLALLAVVHALVSAVRRRRRDFALLKTLGFTRRQVDATVAWQATTLGLVGVVIGVPLGVLLGRALWTSVATSLGVAATPVVPIVALAALVVGALALVNLAAVLPAWRAARTHPAVALRSE